MPEDIDRYRPDIECLRAEASRQELALSDEDLAAIQGQVARVKALLARQRPARSDGLAPPYRFQPGPGAG